MSAMTYRPTDLPELRNDLYDWHDMGLAEFHRKEVMPDGPDKKTPGIGRNILGLAELFYVSPDMAELAVHASKSLPNHFINREDLPADYGFLYSPRALWSEPNEVNGFAWGVHDDGSGFFLAWLTLRDNWVDYLLSEGRTADAETVRLNYPRLHDAFAVTAFGSFSKAEQAKDLELDQGEYSPAFVLKAIWALMQQPFVSDSDAVYDRFTRRRLARKEIELARTRVITLRQAARSSDSADSEREYHHRWIVRGHWRQQPHGPAASLRKLKWIAPHVKGPDGAPLLGGEKVYAWTR